MPKTRHNFTLSSDTINKLKEVENKSETVDKAISYYLANKETKQEKIVEIVPNSSTFRLKRVIK